MTHIEPTELTLAELIEVHNQIAERPIKKFASKAKGAAKVEKLLEEQGKELLRSFPNDPNDNTREIHVVVSQTAEPATDTPKRRGPKPTYSDGAKITVLVANPKRDGSKAQKRFDLYRSGMTVAEFLAAGGVRGDLVWDVEHDHISIEEE